MNSYIEEHQKRWLLRKTPQFKSTNSLWNELKLNHAWAIGYLSHLFKVSGSRSLQEWESFYYSSGEERRKQLQTLPFIKQVALQDFTFQSSESVKPLYFISKKERELNLYYGRTESELYHIGSYLYRHLCEQGNPLGITEEDCHEFVKIRVIDETFIGMMREHNTIQKLQSFFPEATFKEVPVEVDSKYGIDYEVYIGDRLAVALQIKSQHYERDNQEILQKTKAFNQEKHEQYKQKFGVDVLYVFSQENGYIEDKNVFSTIRSYLKGNL